MSDANVTSAQWQRILAEFEGKGDDSIELFNSRFARWEPTSNAVRFYRTALYLAAQSMDAREREILTAIGEKRMRDPHEVRVHGLPVCFDYLQVAFEVAAMSEILATAAGVAEIGAGYGRTCHGILRNFPSVQRYAIIDLPECLPISRRYLEGVLDPLSFAKLRFIPISEVGDGECLGEDLVINIDSMAEMTPDTAQAYLHRIHRHAKAFYCKNPVGKYAPSAIGLQDTAGNPSVEAALQTGLLRSVVDIFDETAIAAQSEAFIEAYCPGEGWTVASQGWAPPWTYYHQAVFKKVGP